jgi:predicted enzyme related to lactoylglutathione lyase
MTLLRFVESVVLFVPDIDSASAWYANLFGVEVRYENKLYAYIRAPGVFIGFHPTDSKCPGGVGGTTAYWEVDDIHQAVDELVRRGATLHRGPAVTSLGAGAAMLICPFGCTIGLNQSSPQSLAALS